jgi:hypothetical protein
MADAPIVNEATGERHVYCQSCAAVVMTATLFGLDYDAIRSEFMAAHEEVDPAEQQDRMARLTADILLKDPHYNHACRFVDDE